MLIKTTVKNKQINLKDVLLDIRKKGIYLLQGENGTGKSCLIRQIVYGENDIEFNNSEHRNKYNENRCDLISYVEQDPVPYNCSVKKYIYRSAEVKDYTLISRLMQHFNMDNVKLNTNIQSLSGGELVKLNIISAIVKKTPYIIMDEPTNNLDNASVRALVSLLEELKDKYTFLIVTHDPRLEFKDYSVVKLSKRLEEEKSHEAEKNNEPTSLIKYPAGRLCASFLTSTYSMLSIISIIALFCVIVILNMFVYYRYINMEERKSVKDVIVTYKVDEQYNELNEKYATHEKIDIDKNKYYQMIYFKDIDKISVMENVDKILLPNVKYIDMVSEILYESINTKTLPEELPVMAIPYDILTEYGGQILMPCDLRMVVKGRLPYDNADEIVISENMLKNKYGVDANDALDSSILVNGKNYTIVGIGYSDICLLSYEEDEDYGYFIYDKDTGRDKIIEIQNYLISQDYYITEGIYNTIIYTHKNCEKEVLNHLIGEYPAENYISAEFQNA